MEPIEQEKEHPTEPLLTAILENQDSNAKSQEALLEAILEVSDRNNIDDLLEANLEQQAKTTTAVKELTTKLEPKELGDGATFIVKGIKGDKGDSGDSIKGDKGDKGEKGDKGDKGDTGTQGIEGKKGKDGINGKDGLNGKDGKKGEKGDKGDKGEPGKDGKSISEELVKKFEKKVKDNESNLLFVNNGAVKSVIAGTNVTVDNTDPQNPIVSATGTGGGHTIQDEGTPLTQRTNLNFVGAGVTVTDGGAGPDSTIVTISGGGGTIDGSGTTNELTYWVDTDTVGALPVATYPSLTEVSYVKGLTSAVQPQLNTQKSSGVLTGGVISIGTGGAGVATTFSITSGTGQIVDNTVNPNTVTSVTWTTKTDVAVTNLLTNLVTFVAIDSGGNVIQSTTDFTPAQMREYIVIGVVVHSNQTTVNAVNQAQIVAYNQGNQLSDLFYSLGLFNVSGNVFSANGANLKLNKSAGSIFRRGANYSSLTDNPHIITTASLTQGSLRMQNQTGAGSASTTDVDVANYDVGGVTTAISPATRFSILRVFLFQSNLIAVQRGQATYLSLAEAKAAIQTETFVTNDVLAANGLLRGFIVAQANATSLSDTSKVFFIDAGKFGGTSGVGGLSVSTLQNAYDNSSTPEVLTDATRGALTIKRGSAADTDNILEILNGAGDTKINANGIGNIYVNNYFANTTSTVSAGGTTVLTIASARTQNLTGAANQTFQLPDATTLALSAIFEFNNNSSGSLIITNAGATTQYTVPAGGAVVCFVTSISTANGAWDFHALAPLAATWSSGVTGLVMNSVLTTSPRIGSGASTSTAPSFIPQRGASTTGFGGDGTDLFATIAGTPRLTISATGITATNLSGTNTGDQTITNSSDATSHTVTLSGSGGSVQLIEGSNITLTTGGTGSAGTVTIAATGGGTNTYFNNQYVDQSGGTSDTYGVLAGTINGSNALFTVSQLTYATGTLKVYLNGQLQTQGTGEDWVETTPASGTFTFAIAPVTGSLITVEYQTATLSTNTVIVREDTSTASFSFVIDEDTMASDSATKVPTQQSVKAYVDANAGSSVAKLEISTNFEDISTRYDLEGSGGTSVTSTNGLVLQSTSTTTRDRQVNMAIGNVSYNIFTKNPEFLCLAHVNAVPTTGSSYLGLGYVDAAGSGHTYTRDHHGFKIVYSGSTAVLSATNANGTTETATDVTSGITVTNNNTYYSIQDGSTNVKYYINGTLVATHTTNLPDSAPLIGAILQWSVSNNSTATDFGLTVPFSKYIQAL